jgi:S1/P1 Nuclease
VGRPHTHLAAECGRGSPPGLANDLEAQRFFDDARNANQSI